jgi:hypothetical protein
MFRQVFIPTEDNNTIPFFNIPREWYGQEIEFLLFPVKYEQKKSVETKEERLLKLCGAWKSEKSAEEIIADIYNSRSSNKTRILEKL